MDMVYEMGTVRWLRSSLVRSICAPDGRQSRPEGATGCPAGVTRLEWGNSGKFQGEQVDGRHASAPFSGASHGFCSRTDDGGGLRHGTGSPWRSPSYLCRRARRPPGGHRGQVPRLEEDRVGKAVFVTVTSLW